MNLTLATKLFIYGLLFTCLLSFSQTESREEVNKDSKSSIFFDEMRQRLFNVSLSYQQPITAGNNFIGKGYKGENGYSFSFSVFLYKQFFIGYNGGNSRFDVKNPEIIGNFQSSRIAENFFFVGYEFLPLKKSTIRC